MKRFLIGVTVLVFLLAISLFVAISAENMYKPVIRLLEEASGIALSGDFAVAKSRAEQAQRLWDKNKNATATVADHTPMEEIDHLFAETKVYATAEEVPHFAACCAQLAAMVRDMRDAHALNLWNLL